MKAGSLDRRIKIQRRVNTQSSSGAVVASWTTIAESRAASFHPTDGKEVRFGPGLEASQTVAFRIRYSSDVSELSPNDRIIFPATSTAEKDIYNIVSVIRSDRNQSFLILANRKEDAQ